MEPLLDDLVVVDFLPVLLSIFDVPVLVGGPLILHETSVQQNTGWLKRERERNTERDRTEKRRERETKKERNRQRETTGKNRLNEREREREREREISMKNW